MTSETEHFGLTKLGPDEDIHSGDGKFPSADRDAIDDLLHAAINHVHDGATAGAATAPTLAPELTPSTTGGTIPAGTTVYYVYTYTDPETGQTSASPEATYTTSDAVAEPVAPTFTLQSIGGTLPAGQYFYVLTAYQTSSTVETKALHPVSVEVPAGTSTNQVELTLPTLSPEATGFNIYRRAPGDTRYYHLDTDAGGTYVDDGSVSPSTRTIPSANTTNGATSIEVAIPGATPSIPAGNTWTIYRSYTTSFLNSYLVNLDEATLTYVDTGSATSTASPPAIGFGSHTSGKIDLTSHVTGLLPAAEVSVDDAGFGTLVGTDAQTLFEYIDTAGVGGGGFETDYGNYGGTETLNVTDNFGNGAFGRIYAGGVGEIAATGRGSFAWGDVLNWSASNESRIQAQGRGATATGRTYCSVTDYSVIRASHHGSFAQGFAYDGLILASDYGAFAGGFARYGGRIKAGGKGSTARGNAEGYSDDTLSRVYASGRGSAVFGRSRSNSATGTAHVYSFGSGSLAHGYTGAGGTSFGEVRASGAGAFAGGRVLTGNARTSMVYASGDGAVAHGFAYNFAGDAHIQATAYGSVSFGVVLSSGTIEATGRGSMAVGSIDSGGTITSGTGQGALAFGHAFGGAITASAHGSFAGGHTNAAGDLITASGEGSMAHGVSTGGFDVIASGAGSGAFGSATAATITATATNAWQLGDGTNAQANSISVAGGIRINGAAAPATPRDGDIWVASGHIYARSNGVTKNLSNIA